MVSTRKTLDGIWRYRVGCLCMASISSTARTWSSLIGTPVWRAQAFPKSMSSKLKFTPAVSERWQGRNCQTGNPVLGHFVYQPVACRTSLVASRSSPPTPRKDSGCRAEEWRMTCCKFLSLRQPNPCEIFRPITHLPKDPASRHTLALAIFHYVPCAGAHPSGSAALSFTGPEVELPALSTGLNSCKNRTLPSVL